MIFDCHYHFERRLLTEKALLKKMDDCGVEKVALMGIINEPIPKPPEFLLKILRFSLTHRFFRFLAKMLAANFTSGGDIKIPTGIFHLYQNPENEPIFQAIEDNPDLKLILAHAGFPLYSDTWDKIKNNKNVYVDLSQTSYLNEHTTRQAVENLGVTRCLFGTDGPYGVHGDDDLFDYSFIKRRIEGLFPDKEIQKMILGENFLALTNT